MEQQIPIQCLYYFLHSIFSFLLSPPPPLSLPLLPARNKRDGAAEGKMQKANNCMRFFAVLLLLLLLRFKVYVVCTWLYANFVLSCCHCKAHSLFYNCHFWLDFMRTSTHTHIRPVLYGKGNYIFHLRSVGLSLIAITSEMFAIESRFFYK